MLKKYQPPSKIFHHLVTVALVMMFLGVPLIGVYTTMYYYKDANTNWAQSQGLLVESDELQMLSTGPFYPLKGATIYQLITKDQRVFWIRHSPLGMEIQELTSEGYKPMSRTPKVAEKNTEEIIKLKWEK